MALISKLLKDKKQKLSNIATNHNKYITSDHESLDYKNISRILQDNEIYITEHQLQIALDKHSFDKQQLLTDLCDAISSENDKNILFTKILAMEFQINDSEIKQKVYNLILHEYIRKGQLDNNNFTKILLHTALELYPELNSKPIEEIVRNEKLSVNVLIKGTNEFKNSVKFGKLFKSITTVKKKTMGCNIQTVNQTIHPKTNRNKSI
eukprot:359043_1